MIKRILLASMFVFVTVAPGYAKNLAVPAKDPVATLTIPNSWKTEEIDFGYSATSPDGDVVFYAEYASAKRIDDMFKLNDEWMKENHIKPKAVAKEQDIDINGLASKLFSYQAKDDDGDTIVDFVLIPGGNGRLILLTLWGSEEERETNKSDIMTIEQSVKPIS